jgi:type IV pilus assembly protein PilF
MLRSACLLHLCTKYLSVFALVFFIVGCTTTKDREEAQFHLRIGTAALEQGKYPAAFKELQIADKLDPKNAVIHNNLGLAYFLRERYELAANEMLRAIEIDPSYSEARNNLGRTLIEMGRYEAAIRELQRVLADLTYTDPAKAWVNLGLAHFRQKDFESAKHDFSEALKINREHCLGQTLYGRSLFELKNYPDAAQALDNAVVVCKEAKFDEPHYYSGLAYYKLGRTSSAIARMEEVIKLYPGSAYAKKAESLLKIMK